MGCLSAIFKIKRAKFVFMLFLPVFVSGCLYLDIGTVLSLKRLDPYSIDLVNSRAAILLPEDIIYAENINVTVRVTQGGKVLREEVFALEVLEDGEDLAGIDLQKFTRKPLVVRLAKQDFERATHLQTRLGELDKNHEWVEPGRSTVGEPKTSFPDEPLVREVAPDEKASGDLTIDWVFDLLPEGKEKYCHRHKKVKLTIWVKVDEERGFRRVVHGLPLKKLYGRKGMQTLCEEA